jgi:hypothetical protein
MIKALTRHSQGKSERRRTGIVRTYIADSKGLGSALFTLPSPLSSAEPVDGWLGMGLLVGDSGLRGVAG